jgi:hypothetical protein
MLVMVLAFGMAVGGCDDPTTEEEELESPYGLKLEEPSGVYTLYWYKVNGASGYNIEYNTKNDFSTSSVASGYNGPGYYGYCEFTGVHTLKVGTKYYFRVRAYSHNKFSEWSTVYSATTYDW